MSTEPAVKFVKRKGFNVRYLAFLFGIGIPMALVGVLFLLVYAAFVYTALLFEAIGELAFTVASWMSKVVLRVKNRILFEKVKDGESKEASAS